MLRIARYRALPQRDFASHEFFAEHTFADGSRPLQYGLIAEEVAEIYPDLVAHSADGQIETVKYQVLDSLLLNEVQREDRELHELRARIAELESLLLHDQAREHAGSGARAARQRRKT
jgi:hypothetical protein